MRGAERGGAARSAMNDAPSYEDALNVAVGSSSSCKLDIAGTAGAGPSSAQARASNQSGKPSRQTWASQPDGVVFNQSCKAAVENGPWVSPSRLTCHS